MADLGITNYVFPSDLTSDQQKHYMKIQIFPSPSSKTSAGQRHAIYLFIPGGNQNGPMTWQMVHEYDDVKLTRLGAAIIGGMTRAIPGVGNALTAAGSAAMGAALTGARLAGMGTINPKVDVLYGNTELRQFQFSFFMAPQSEKESKELDKIVRVLRKFSSPEISRMPGTSGYEFVDSAVGVLGNALPSKMFNNTSGQGTPGSTPFENALETGLWFIPPAEFLVSFHTVAFNPNNPSQTAEQDNPYLPKIGRCVLARVDVDYTLQGEYSTFKDGSPTNLQLTLVFREMRVISQTDVANGY